MARVVNANSLRATIAEIEAFDQLHALSDAYELAHGHRPHNVSHWDPSDDFVEAFSKRLPIAFSGEAIRYRYSMRCEARPKVLEKLSQAPPRRILITENGTAAVLAAANCLGLLGVRRVILLCPCYFAARYALSAFGIDILPTYWIREGGTFRLPHLSLQPDDAIWIENPVFNTGVSAMTEVIAPLEEVLRAGRLVVADGSLEPPDRASTPLLARYRSYISVHAPHKSICVNGLKFGAVTFDPAHYELFSHWADILGGGLSLSAEIAIDHFLSPSFDAYRASIEMELRASDTWLLALIESFGNALELDAGSVGYWRTVYAHWLPAQFGDDTRALWRLIEASGAAIIPGTRAAFDPKWGFCFRVNLLRMGPRERAALRRLLKALVAERSCAGG